MSLHEGIRELGDVQFEAPSLDAPRYEAHELLLAFKAALWERL